MSVVSSFETLPLSVVIATLGGDVLQKTISHLNRGTVVPSEILICIPEGQSGFDTPPPDSNVKVIRTSCRGQVAQRAIGFQKAQYELVLQLDDDIFVRPTCLQELVSSILLSSNLSVGPKLFDAKSGMYHSFMIPNDNSLFERLMYWIINGQAGYQPGRLSKSGLNMGLPEVPGEWRDVDWLPGGCILHWKKNLVLTNFYPFRGKAFAEDLFHSLLLRQKKIQLMRSGSAICDVDFSSLGNFSPVSFLKGYLAYCKAMVNITRQVNGSLTSLYQYLFINLFAHVFRKIFTSRLGF